MIIQSLQTSILFLSIAALGLVADQCGQKKPVSNEPEAKEILADKIAFAGHGMLFDKKLKRINPDSSLVLRMLDSIRKEVLKEAKPKQMLVQDKAILKAEELLKMRKLDEHEKILVTAAVLDRLLEGAPQVLYARYGWRSNVLLSHYLQRRRDWVSTIRPELLELLRELGLFTPPELSTNYIRDCRAHDVPIPPDWAESGTAWVQQGTLTTNLLQPGGFAAVWTYSDPARRGACIALPRGSGSFGSAAGIICQSATTGHACFWDNKLRSVSPEQFIGWSGQTLRIAELKDGSNLNSSCTGCHHGNNVYLISPDDATWGKVLRGPLNGVRTLTFTTRVETSTDNQGGRPRYIPITTIPERTGWENTFSTVTGGCTTCHEFPALPVAAAPTMPPGCASSPTDPTNCYGTP